MIKRLIFIFHSSSDPFRNLYPDSAGMPFAGTVDFYFRKDSDFVRNTGVFRIFVYLCAGCTIARTGCALCAGSEVVGMACKVWKSIEIRL